MIAGAFELHGLAVQEKTFVRVPCDGTHAERNALGIASFAARFDGHYYRVETRSLGRPQRWAGQPRNGCKRCRTVGSDLLRSGIRSGDGLPCWINYLPAHTA